MRRMLLLLSLCALLTASSNRISAAQSCSDGPVKLSPAASHDGLRYPLTTGPLSWTVMGGPLQPVQGTDGKVHLVYSLQVVNAWSMPASILSVEAVSYPDKRVLPDAVLAISGEPVTGMVRLFGASQTFTAKDFVTSVPAGQTAVLYVDLTFGSFGDVPHSIAHRVRTQVPKPVLGQTVLTTEGDPTPVSCTRPIRIGSPLRGTGWLDGNGCCKELGPHRLVMNSINGGLNPTEAFAIDWIEIDTAGKAFHGDMKDPKNWYGYGKPIVAVADGEVVKVLSNLKDGVPGANPDGLTLAEIAGNHVIEKLDENHYAEYDHMAPNSILVHVGDKIKRGQKLGELGNTGNSDSPHLHFQLMDRPSTLDGYALPFSFDKFTLEGRIATSLEQLDDQAMQGKPLMFERQDLSLSETMPLSRDVITFP